jgi:hypothetical protein
MPTNLVFNIGQLRLVKAGVLDFLEILGSPLLTGNQDILPQSHI